MRQDKGVNEGLSEIIGMRNHISSVLEQMWGVLAAWVLLFITNEEMLGLAVSFLREGNILKAFAAVGIFFVLFIVIVAFYVNRWYKTTITVKDNMVTIEQRTLNRYTNSIAVQNISNINLEQNLFEMLMGTYKLMLDTNSLTTAESTDVKIILSKKNAYLVKDVIMDMMKKQELLGRQNELSDAVDNGELTREEAEQQLLQEQDYLHEDEEKDYDIIYSTKDIIVNSLLNTSVILLVVSITLLVTGIISIIHTLGSGISIASALFSVIVQLGLAGSFLSAIFHQWLDDFNFRAKRDKDKIYVSTGLLKKRKYAVPINKINAVRFQWSFWSRLFHRFYVEVINIGGEGEEADGMKLLLMGTEQQIKQQLAVLLPEYPFPEQSALKRQPARIFVKEIVKSVVFIIIAACLTYFAINMIFGSEEQVLYNRAYLIALSVLAALFCLLIVGSVFSYIAVGLSSNRNYLVLGQGMFARWVMTIPYQKMQYLTHQQKLFDRLLGVKRLQIHILASIAGRTQVTGRYLSGDFEEITEHFQTSYRESANGAGASENC